METSYTTSAATRFKVGVFTVLGIVAAIFVSIFITNRPSWWRPCQYVKINVEDATGLNTKSPVRSLGIQVGYLKTVELFESHVALGVCLTAPVELLPSTRAYIRGEGFLGDRFVELKPLKYITEESVTPASTAPSEVVPASQEEKGKGRGKDQVSFLNLSLNSLYSLMVPHVYAETPLKAQGSPSQEGTSVLNVSDQRPPSELAGRKAPSQFLHKSGPGGRSGKEIPVGEESQDIQHLVTRVDELVDQMSGLTDNLKQAIDPEDLKKTMKQLNRTLENASRTLSPEGGLNQTAQRTLGKLEDAIEQLRDVMTRVNKGEGSVGMLLNDPAYADEIKSALKNLNQFLNKANRIRLNIDLGGAAFSRLNGGRGWFHLGIWPKVDRYYLIGISGDSRGRISNRVVTTQIGNQTQTYTTTIVDPTELLITAMLGKVYWGKRVDLSVGALYGDGAVSAKFNVGPSESEEMFQVRVDGYIRNAAGIRTVEGQSQSSGLDSRLTVSFLPIPYAYVRAGVESLRQFSEKSANYFVGAGITFDDEDIKLLLSLR